MTPSFPIFKCTGDATGKYIFLQYTGLKDSKGVGIYEGDIVELVCQWDHYNDWTGEGDKGNITYTGPIVILATKGACIRKPYWIDHMEGGKTGRSPHDKPIAAYRSTIIGNIYENPELLK